MSCEFGEPWAIKWDSENGQGYFVGAVKTDGDKEIVRVIRGQTAVPERVIACVNFCRNMPTEYLAGRVVDYSAPTSATAGVIGVKLVAPEGQS